MKRLNEEYKQQIADAIREAERQSSCEFVSVITQKSGDYRSYAFFAAALGALLLPHIVHSLYAAFGLETMFRMQIVLFIILMVLTQLSFITRNLVPSSIKRSQAALVAAESFRKFGLYRTKKRRAILFFVSLDEKFATIVTDIGIDERIPPQTWQALINDFRQKLESHQIGEGYLEAIQKCTEILKREFPPEEGDANELPNELIVERYHV